MATRSPRADAMSRIAGIILLVGVVMAGLTACTSAPVTSSTPDAPVAPARYAATRSQVVKTAMKYVGTPYARGGTSPAGFDCSGFVMFVYGRAGVRLPHGAGAQYQLGSSVAREDLQPGDLVFFDRLRHSGIYIGDRRFIHATKPGDVVKISGLDEEWYRRRWVGARRLL